MKNCAFILIFFVFACSKNRDNHQTPNTQENNVENNSENKVHWSIHDFLRIDSSEYIFFPLYIYKYNKGKEGLLDKIASSDYGKFRDKWGESYAFNFMIYNIKTKEQYLLEEDFKMIIKQYNFNGYSSDYSSREDIVHVRLLNSDSLLFYEIIHEDYNKDTILNYQDPTYIFISNKKGKSFMSISPKEAHVNSWRLVDNKVIMYTSIDENKDLLFDEKDVVEIYEYDLSTKELSKLLSAESMGKINKHLQRFWKMK